jgi:hypothetical protein
MTVEIPELVFKSAEKTLREFCSTPIVRSGQEFLVLMEPCPGGFDLMVSRFDSEQHLPLARLQFSPELGQWTLHRPRESGRWSYVPEAGGALDLSRLLRYVKEDPLNLFWTLFC